MLDPLANFERVTLPNGLTIHASHWPDRPWQHVDFLIHSGADQDTPGLEGTAHFMEHLVCENGIVPRQEVEQFIESHGGHHEFGATGFAGTYYGFSLPACDAVLKKGFDMFGEMLLHAKLEKYVERERQVILGEFRQYFPADYVHELEMRKNRSLYPGYALGRMALPLGTLDTIGKISQPDLQRFYDMYYTPANMSVVCVGGISLGGLFSLLMESPFSARKPGSRTRVPSPETVSRLPHESRHTYRQSDYISTKVEAGKYTSAAKVPASFSKGVMKVFRNVLQEKLFDEVRLERAWTYDISVHWESFRSFYELDITAEGLKLEAMDSIEDVVDACILDVCNDPEMFERTRKSVIARASMLDMPGSEVLEMARESLSTYGRIRTLQEEVDELRDVQFEDIRDLADSLAARFRHTQLALP